MYFLAQDHYYDREQLYGTADGDYWDNCERFVFFCRAGLEAVARLGEEDGGAAWRPQIVHAHDWQTGLVPVYLHTLYRDHPTPGEGRHASSPSTTSPTRACSGTTTCR